MVVTPAVPFFSLKEEMAEQVISFISSLTTAGLVKTRDDNKVHPLFSSVPLSLDGTVLMAHVHVCYYDGVSFYIPGLGWMAPAYMPYAKPLVDLFLQVANNIQRVYYYAWLDN